VCDHIQAPQNRDALRSNSVRQGHNLEEVETKGIGRDVAKVYKAY